MSKVILKGFIEVAGPDLEAVLAELHRHIELTRQEPGCIKFEVTQDTGNANRFAVYEEFKDEEAFQSHQQRAQASEWGRVTVNVQRHFKVTHEPE